MSNNTTDSTPQLRQPGVPAGFTWFRTGLRIEDWARTHQVSFLKGAWNVLRSATLNSGNLSIAIANLLASGKGERRYRTLSRYAVRVAATQSRPPAGGPSKRITLERSIIVKPPVNLEERGILFVSFETELAKLLDHPRFSEVEARYQIAFLPTWQPAYSTELFRLAAVARLPYLLLPACEHDLQLADELGPLCIPLPLQAASWIDAARFPPGDCKDIDIVLLANFSKYKRHWRLFEALSTLPFQVRVVCAGRPWGGRDAAALQQECRAFGCENMVEFVENPTDADVAALLARSRLFCAMSHKEGSFIAVAEALVSDTPVGMFDDAIIGTKPFINAQTGFLFRHDRPLGPQLADALRTAHQKTPRTWAMREITADVSMQRFNMLMRQHSQSAQLPWTADAMAIHSRNFSFGYMLDADRMRAQPFYEQLDRELGLSMVLCP